VVLETNNRELRWRTHIAAARQSLVRRLVSDSATKRAVRDNGGPDYGTVHDAATTDNCERTNANQETLQSVAIERFWRHVVDVITIYQIGSLYGTQDHPRGRGQLDAAFIAGRASKDEQTGRQRTQAHTGQFDIPVQRPAVAVEQWRLIFLGQTM